MAIYWGVQKFYQYLIRNKFILCSDRRSLMALFRETKCIHVSKKSQRWADFLSGFDYEFQYRIGTENNVED